MAKDDTTLFVFGNAGSYRLQRYIIEKAVQENRRVALLFTGGRDAFFSSVRIDAARLNILALALDDEVELLAAPIAWWPAKKTLTWRAMVCALAALFSPRAKAFRQAWARRLTATLQLMWRLEVRVVVCSEDGISGDLAVIAAARNINALVVDVPYGNGTVHELEADLGRKYELGQLITVAGWRRFFLTLIAPQWIKRGLYDGAIMYPLSMLVAIESLGITLSDAWVIHGGMSNVLCVENEIGLCQYKREGIDAAKLKLTGSPYCDMLVEALRGNAAAAAALRKPRRIEEGRLRILVSWPPSYHDTYPEKNQFVTYEEMTAAIFTFLKKMPNIHLTVSLHPACGEDIKVIFQGLEIDITEADLFTLIPSHDVFITYFSSTIRWALAAGKVVVNYDAYNLKLTTFNSAPSFFNADTFEQFCNELSRLAGSQNACERAMSRQSEVADDWGVLDGHAIDRILCTIDTIK